MAVLEATRPRPRRPPQLDDRALLHRLYVHEQKSLYAIAEMLDCGTSTVHRALHRLSIPIRRERPRLDPAVEARLDNPAWLRERYEVEQYTLAEIADELGCAPATVMTALRRHGIPPPRRVRASTRRRQSRSARRRVERERAERQARERENQEARRQQLQEALELLGPADPNKKMLVLLMVCRRRRENLGAVWDEMVELAIDGAKFEGMWRAVFSSPGVRKVWRESYVRVGRPLRVPSLRERDHRDRSSVEYLA